LTIKEEEQGAHESEDRYQERNPFRCERDNRGDRLRVRILNRWSPAIPLYRAIEGEAQPSEYLTFYEGEVTEVLLGSWIVGKRNAPTGHQQLMTEAPNSYGEGPFFGNNMLIRDV